MRTLVSFLIVLIGVYLYVARLPGSNGLGFYSTPNDVIERYGLSNVMNKNIIITGGHSGIGLETVIALANNTNASIWVPVRESSLERCKKEMMSVSKVTKNTQIYCEVMDLSSIVSVRQFCENWNKKELPLHILVNNAGVLSPVGGDTTVNGYETIFATNHLGHFLLTELLFEKLKEGKPSRVITLSSINHLYKSVNLNDLSGFNTWRNGSWYSSLSTEIGPFLAYSQSKTANILFTIELAKRMKDFGLAFSLHPGTIRTPMVMNSFLGSIVNSTWRESIEYLIDLFPLWKSSLQGASTTLYTILSNDIIQLSGKYFCDCQVSYLPSYAEDEEIASKLWSVSENMISNSHC